MHPSPQHPAAAEPWGFFASGAAAAAGAAAGAGFAASALRGTSAVS